MVAGRLRMAWKMTDGLMPGGSGCSQFRKTNVGCIGDDAKGWKGCRKAAWC